MVSKKDVQEFCPEILKDAEDSGVDVKGVVKEIEKKYGERYSQRTVLSKVRAELRRRIREATAETDKVVIAGSRDRHNFNMPVSLLCLKKDGNHKEVRTFSYDNVQYGSEKISVPAPSMATLKMHYNQQYENYTLAGIEDYKELDNDELIEKLEKIAVFPSELGEDDQYSIVVVKGKIRQIYPATTFDDDGKPAGQSPVMDTDARNNPTSYPVMQIKLESDDNEVMPRLLLERPRHARPIYNLGDFEMLCRDAMEEFDEPQEQARFISESMEGRSIVAVGVLMKYNPGRQNETDDVIYVDIGAGYIGEINDAGQSTKKEGAKEEEESQGEAMDMTQYNIKPQVRAYLRARKVEASEVDAAEIVEALGLQVPHSVCKQTLEELQDEGE